MPQTKCCRTAINEQLMISSFPWQNQPDDFLTFPRQMSK